MSWLNKEPATAPPEPADVDVADVMADAEKNNDSAALQYFRAHAPHVPVDMWGLPLPLSRVDQDRANRLWALLASPLHRGRALIRSGVILRDEAALIHEVYPDLWLMLSDELDAAMVSGRPPFPVWAEALIGTWYGLPPKVAFAQAQGGKAPRGGSKTATAGHGAMPTPADRRELALRE